MAAVRKSNVLDTPNKVAPRKAKSAESATSNGAAEAQPAPAPVSTPAQAHAPAPAPAPAPAGPALPAVSTEKYEHYYLNTEYI